MFSLGGCFPPYSLATAKAKYSVHSTTPFPPTAYGTITLFSVAFQPTSAVIGLGCNRCKLTPHLYYITAAIRFGLCRFRSPLLTVSQLISFPLATQMFPFAKVHVPQREQEKPRRDSPTKSHSGILGSTDACSYPRHIAACHALLRLPSQAIHHTASARRMVTFSTNAYATCARR